MGFLDCSTSYEEIQPRRSHSIFTLKHLAVGISVAGILVALILVVTNVGRNREVEIPSSPTLHFPFLVSAEADDEDTLVNLENGTVQGFKMISREGRQFLAFRGIPFAQPPVGVLRFQPPENLNIAWSGTMDATKFKPDCMQSSPDGFRGEEDCLYLNIYTPAFPKAISQTHKQRNLLPIMVYIHGGIAGGSVKRNSGEFFMDEDIVLVGVNYRVGILGNLNTNDVHARGNQGSRDIIKSLEWIQKNIEGFGGDNEKVTLFGNSYGAMSISALMLSPMSNGLFHRAILQSGTSLEPEFLQPNPLTQARNLGRKLECNSNASAELVACFQNMDAGTLVTHSLEPAVQGPFNDKIWENKFTATVDPRLENIEDVFLSESPLKLLQKGQRIPLIIGLNSLEGLPQSTRILRSWNLTQAYNEDWDNNAIQMLRLDRTNYSLNKTKSILSSVRYFYFGQQNICEETRANLTDAYTDRIYMHPANTLASFYNQDRNGTRNQNVYLYYFDKFIVSTFLNRSDLPDQFKKEPTHTDELQFLFKNDRYPVMDSTETNFSKMMVRLWAAFARDGVPGKSDNNQEWQPIRNKPYEWFQLNSDPKMSRFHENRIKFWDSFNSSDIYL